MTEPFVEIAPKSNGKGPYVRLGMDTEHGNIRIELNGSAGRFGAVCVTIDLEKDGEKFEGIPYEFEMGSYRKEDDVRFPYSNQERADFLLEETVFVVEDFMPTEELTPLTNCFLSAFRKLERSQK